MIRIFSATDQDFTTNGDVIVKATRATIHKQDNGDFYLEIEALHHFDSFSIFFYEIKIILIKKDFRNAFLHCIEIKFTE